MLVGWAVQSLLWFWYVPCIGLVNACQLVSPLCLTLSTNVEPPSPCACPPDSWDVSVEKAHHLPSCPPPPCLQCLQCFFQALSLLCLELHRGVQGTHPVTMALGLGFPIPWIGEGWALSPG